MSYPKYYNLDSQERVGANRAPKRAVKKLHVRKKAKKRSTGRRRVR